ncbi:hypothetical protein B0H17DRAFT_1130648 [Mycena rosella]|uniref:Uncharacterized protein n=1 Tax=Mycena rosella TaxID=1033263 RepID=A0AAD7DQX9_MYCRO|nr:hypothetical protein B0H17DRAFT_1130648 [Mycena rosella]
MSLFNPFLPPRTQSSLGRPSSLHASTIQRKAHILVAGAIIGCPTTTVQRRTRILSAAIITSATYLTLKNGEIYHADIVVGATSWPDTRIIICMKPTDAESAADRHGQGPQILHHWARNRNEPAKLFRHKPVRNRQRARDGSGAVRKNWTRRGVYLRHRPASTMNLNRIGVFGTWRHGLNLDPVGALFVMNIANHTTDFINERELRGWQEVERTNVIKGGGAEFEEEKLRLIGHLGVHSERADDNG